MYQTVNHSNSIKKARESPKLRYFSTHNTKISKKNKKHHLN